MEQTPPHALKDPRCGINTPASLPPPSPPRASQIGFATADTQSAHHPELCPTDDYEDEQVAFGGLTRRHTVALPRAPPSPPPSQPFLTAQRGPSLSAPALPPLDFSALCSSAASPAPCTARRNVDAITSNLSRVRPFLYVTGVHAARSLTKLREAGITHILNLAGATANNFHQSAAQFTYCRLSPRDDATEDISSFLDITTAFIDTARAANPAAHVAVHCHMGVSRSATAAAAYMIMAEGLSLEAAMTDLRRARPIADPNSSFVLALEQLAFRVRSGRPRPALFRVQPHGAVDTQREQPILVPALQPETVIMDAAHVWILAHPTRAGFEVLCGPDAPPSHFTRAVELANLFAKHEERYEAMFPIVTRGPSHAGRRTPFQCPVLVLGPEQWGHEVLHRFATALQTAH